jgi:hypothetical protein
MNAAVRSSGVAGRFGWLGAFGQPDANLTFNEEKTLMNNRKHYDEEDAHHAQRFKQLLNDSALHARDSLTKVSDPEAQVLFEATAEVLNGLAKAFEDFEQKRGRWFRPSPSGLQPGWR